ncbi:MAG TPA: hypothetical protein VHG33_06090, partial [Woeseiaceae bacterium]|nr:hypothetical protein [Woeseiaceae bacterium]
VDFSGRWVLRTDAEIEQRRLNEAIRRTDGVDSGPILQPADVRRDGYRGRRRDHGGLVHVFLEHGRQLRITQTASAIFISFDRAVVEEFRFGENRKVSVGPVVADRVSGWDGDAYVVETLDEKGMKLTERFDLVGNGDTLRRTIVLRARNHDSVTVVQAFDRVEPSS